ncbi:ABC transporter ATP-binding protein [Halorubrum sp. AD140]|uniref:ABC transporter ATP-binding protein n=1 Tax=Halorubrum sp. AD140 TaxID=3050073 RepID=UPI002ACCC285|nr:ABC transporter ATP-binding protein [Halorubrum sp. AD140]MDZ5809789.1 ABC transporter ATP-binding protein [Halorubrum sp. AD140]
MTDEPLAELSDVTRTYGGVTVLDDVSLEISTGVTAVVGPNGSGKSTLLGTLAGPVEPTEGTVCHAVGEATKPIGYLPQHVPFRGGFTARETLAFYARFVEGDPDAALDRVGLADAADRRVEALSGGMRRLLGIAQALVGDPPLVVLDEPASGLDPEMRERAFRTAVEQSTDDTAVVVSSHDLMLVDEYADEIVVLDRGRVAASGPRDRLLSEHDAADVDGLYRSATRSDAADGGDRGDDGEDDEGASSVHVTGVSE